MIAVCHGNPSGAKTSLALILFTFPQVFSYKIVHGVFFSIFILYLVNGPALIWCFSTLAVLIPIAVHSV